MTKTEGYGKKNKICVLWQGNGVGDDVCFLPILWQKIQDGFEIDLHGNLFTAPLFEKIGVRVFDGELTKNQLGTIETLQQKYGAIYSIVNSCLEHEDETKGYVTKTRFEQMAEYLETTVPDNFKYDFLNEEPNRDRIIFSPWSRSRQRSYPYAEEAFEALDFLEDTECVGLFMQNRETLDSLIEKIYHAKLVIAIDNGILHLALAMGTPVIALMGGSDEWSIVWQYGKYRDLKDVYVLRSEIKNSECSRPCSFHPNRGYGIDGKCTKTPFSDCMSEISTDDIISLAKKVLYGEKKNPLRELALTMQTSEREKEDSDVIYEVIESDCYDLQSLKVTPKVIFDIGAHIGSFGVFAHSLFPEARIFSFEPDKNNYEILSKNTPFAVNYNAAISYGNEEMVLVESEGATGGNFISSRENVSLLSEKKHEHDGYKYSEGSAVNKMTVEEVFDAYELEGIDLLKIDCEGSEWDILENLSARIAKTVKIIKGEYHTFNGKTLHEFKTLLITKFPNMRFSFKANATHGIFEGFLF